MAIGLIVNGAAGRMGRQVIAAASASPSFQVAAALVRPGSPSIGIDAGTLAGVNALGVAATADVAAALAAGDVAVDFSTPEIAVAFTREAAAIGKPVVVATTGLSADQLAALRVCAEHAPVLFAPNLSLGINVLAEILPVVVRALGADYDIEIIEAHHRHKKDSPSGTAIRIAEAIASALDRPWSDLERHGRWGMAPRQTGEIGMHSVRAGGIVGEHRVLFVSDGEEIEINHRAFSRQTFALGALRAAQFLSEKPTGYYSMQDVIRS